jgi:hypothetical protein
VPFLLGELAVMLDDRIAFGAPLIGELRRSLNAREMVIISRSAQLSPSRSFGYFGGVGFCCSRGADTRLLVAELRGSATLCTAEFQS